MSSAPYLRMYVKDWLGDPNVAGLDYELQGVYISILFRMWQSPSCSLPNDDAWLSRMLGVHTNKWAKWRKVLIDGPAPVLFAKDGLISNPRLIQEFNRMADRSEKSSMAIKTRWDRFHGEGDIADENRLSTAGKKVTKKPKKLSPDIIQPGLDLGVQPDQEAPTPHEEKPVPFVSLILADKSKYDVLTTEMLSYSEFYPGIDLKNEFRKMAAWTMSNTKFRKTRVGTPRFINAWLSEAQNKLTARPSVGYPTPAQSNSITGFNSAPLQDKDYRVPKSINETVLEKLVRESDEAEKKAGESAGSKVTPVAETAEVNDGN